MAASGYVSERQRATVEPALEPGWWARGLTLPERAEGAPGAGDAAGRRRLERWISAYGPDAGQFPRRLADAGLDEAGLLGLLTESPAALSARTSRPAWAASVERAVKRAPTMEEAPPGGDWLAAFGSVLRPLLAEAADLLRRGARRLPAADVDAIVADFADRLGRRLAGMAARTLVLELNVQRVDGRLTADDPRERFAEFVRRTATRPGLVRLFDEYPVLARLLDQTARHAVDALLELLNRYAADRFEIVQRLLDGADPGPLVEVRTGLGDTHRRGRSVAVLRFADGRAVVYKPRSLAVYAHFADLVSRLNLAVPGLDLRAVAALRRPAYGWLEFIPSEPCPDAAGVARFYRRQGALLALLYAVGASDIHCENLIACRDRPVLVDLETLFHPSLPAGQAASDPAAHVLADSVYRTALLPQMIVGDNGALDLSGLGGDAGTAYPDDGVAFDLAQTDEMRLVRRAVEFRGALNRVRVATGEEADPGQYEAALLSGFRAGYDAIARHRADFVRLIRRCGPDEVRVVVRPTRLYTTLLDESTHPEVLRDALERDRVLDLLWSISADDPLRERLVRHELADIWAGDVPLFVTRPDSRDVWTSTGHRLPDVLDAAGLDLAVERVTPINPLDRRQQEWIISAALAVREGGARHAGDRSTAAVAAVAADPGRLLAAACGIADQLVASGIGDGDRVNWLGLELVDERQWMLLPMGAGLGAGYCGVALFLAQLADLTGVARYAELARRAARPAPQLCRALGGNAELVRAVGPGGFAGWGGIAYALARLSVLLDDPELAAGAADAVELAGLVVDGAATGVVAGDAGCVAAMLAVRQELGLDAADRVARACADRLVDAVTRGQTGDGTGFAAGAAGVGWALARYAAAGGDPAYADAAGTALARCPLPPPADPGWCAGAAGVLLARATVPSGDTEATALAARPPLRDLSLCHGELGVAEALTTLAAGHGGARAARERRRRAALVLAALDRDGPRCGVPRGVPSPGLLTGLAGIGYGLLRLGRPDRVPSVLLLDPAPGGADGGAGGR
jgi:type 2 lantibiotic biosynthesis protein LanM